MKTNIRLLLALAFASLSPLAPPLSAQTITTTTLDVGNGGDLGQYSSQAIVVGNPAIAYYDASNGDLKYVRANNASGTNWGTPVTLDSSGNVGLFISLAVVNGTPAISYYDSGNGNLKYMRSNTPTGTLLANWSLPVTLDSSGDVGQYTSLAVVNGNPAISYYDNTFGNLKYVRANTPNGTLVGDWGTPVMLDSTGTVGQYTALKVINGNPAVSYHDATNGDLKYVRATTTSGTLVTDWGTPVTLDNSGNVGQYTSLAVITGNPAISYYDSTNGNLKYIRATTTSGTLLTDWGLPVALDSTGDVGQYTSLGAVNGNPAISYYDPTNGDLKYVRSNTAVGMLLPDWGTPVVVSATGNTGQFTSLVMTIGVPAICYYDFTNQDLKFVQASNPNGTAWPTAIVVDASISLPLTGQYTSQAIVNGNPAVSYYDNTAGDLKFMRATNAAGTSWGTPVIVSSTGTVGQYTSLAMVAGIPAISYYDATSGDLKYVRALDPIGTTWGPPVTPDSTGDVGQYTALATGGILAISYYDATNFDLKYVRALDPIGTTWGPPVTLDSTGDVGQYTSLLIVSGNPAISYHDGTNGDLKYLRANTTTGTLVTDWATPVTLDNTGNVGQYAALAVINGNPAISYYDATNGNLKYIRANTTNGTLVTDWGTPVTLDITNNVGQYTSLKVIMGNPAISYYDLTNGDLRYVRANTASGTLVTDWGIPMTIDSIGIVGRYTSLAVIPGSIAISYYNETTGDLKWATMTFPPDIVVTQVAGLTDGVGSVTFGTVAAGNSSGALTFTITNTGIGDLTGLAVSKDGANATDFTVSALSATSVPVGSGTATFIVTFTPVFFATAARTAALHIANNDIDENPFDITVTGTGVTTGADTDSDGLNDLAEFQYTTLGFDWQVGGLAQQTLVNTLNSGANAAGHYTPAQVQALNVGVPLIQRNPTTGLFTLTIGVTKTTTLSLPFTAFPLNAPGTSAVINAPGKLEFQFPVTDNAAFFRLESQ